MRIISLSKLRQTPSLVRDGDVAADVGAGGGAVRRAAVGLRELLLALHGLQAAIPSRKLTFSYHMQEIFILYDLYVLKIKSSR